MLVVVLHGVQIGQHQRRGVTGGDHGDVGAGEAVDVLADPVHQTVDQAGESEHRTGLHALDGVLADHRPRPGELDPAQRRRARGRRIRGHLDAGSDCPTEEFTLGRDHVDTDRRAEVHHDGGGLELGVGGQAVDDPVGADLFGIVDQQRDPGAHAGLDRARAARAGQYWSSMTRTSCSTDGTVDSPVAPVRRSESSPIRPSMVSASSSAVTSGSVRIRHCCITFA